MSDNKFNKIIAGNYVFLKKFSNDDFIILLLFVDDMLVVGSSMKMIKELKEKFREKFSTKDL